MSRRKGTHRNTEIVRLEQELTRQNPTLFNGIDGKKKDEILKTISYRVEQVCIHSGPLPAPETLTAYDDTIENGAERIMKMAENQSDHRMGLEKSVIKSQIWQSYIGQFFALIISLTTIGCSTYVILQGFEWPGSILGSLGLVGLVYVFIQGQRSQNKDLAIKKQQVQKR